MPAEPPHYELWLPVVLAALGERNTVLALLLLVVLCSFAQTLSQNDVTMRVILDFLDAKKRLVV